MEYLDKAGEQAMQNYASKEVIQFFRQALELDEKMPGPEPGRLPRERQIRRARWHSRIGLAYYGMGSLPDCEKHVREALHLLEYPIPKSRTQFAFGLLPQIVRQVFHRYFPTHYIGSLKGQQREIAIEVSRLYELMGRSYFYSQETLPMIYCVLRLVNISERAGPSPELAAAYAGLAIMAGFAQLHSLADIYVDRALAVAKSVNQPSNLITVGVLTSVYQIAVGRWDEIRTRAKEARAICEQLGDYRQWGDSMEVLGESALIAGDLPYALDILKTLLEDARRRRNPLQVCWGLFGVAAIKIRMGDEASAIPMLEEELQILEELPNLASSINTNGQLALAHLRLGRYEEALTYADKVMDLAANKSPTVYSMDIGFSAAAEVYFELWEKALQNSSRGLDAAQHKLYAEKAINLLRTFQKVFPIGQAYTCYYQGWYEDLIDKPQMAIKSWRKGLEAAQKFNLLYEEGLIRVKLASSLRDNPGVCREHLERAIQIFEKMGATHELRFAKWSWETLAAKVPVP